MLSRKNGVSRMTIARVASRLAALLSPPRKTERRTDVPGDEQERMITSRLLAGAVSRPEYHREMARLARTTASVPLPPDDPAHDPRYLLAVVGTTLPEIEPTTLCRAYVLARSGGDTADLMRLLGLTEAQARTILAAAVPHGA